MDKQWIGTKDTAYHAKNYMPENKNPTGILPKTTPVTPWELLLEAKSGIRETRCYSRLDPGRGQKLGM